MASLFNIFEKKEKQVIGVLNDFFDGDYCQPLDVKSIEGSLF